MAVDKHYVKPVMSITIYVKYIILSMRTRRKTRKIIQKIIIVDKPKKKKR